MKLVVRDFPLLSHPDAQKAAEAVHCAGDQGQYWPMHASLFANQSALGLNDLLLRARELGLDLPQFRQCLDSGKYAAEINQQKESGNTIGIRSVPTFLIGLTDPASSKVKVLQIIQGAKSYPSFKEALDSLLAQNP